MKNTAINTLSYTGIVTLSRYNGSKKIKIAQIHNEGGYPLFNFLSDCLIGDFEIAKLNRPIKIMLLDRTANSGGSYEYTEKSGFIFAYSTPEKVYDNEKTGAKSTVRYSFRIPRDLLEGTTFNSIGLYTNSASTAENWAAVVVLDEEDRATVTSVSNSSVASALVLDWELNFYNNVDVVHTPSTN